MMLSLLLGLGTSVASASVLRRSECSFQIHGSGPQEGPLGEIGSGQVRFGDIAPTTFHIKDGKVWGKEGKGCWWTPPTSVLQCDVGQPPVQGFGIDCANRVSFGGQTTFYQCATGDGNQWNIYLRPNEGQDCGEVTLTASGCHATCHPAHPPPPPPLPIPQPTAAVTPSPLPAPAPAPSPKPHGCPDNLQGAYEFPHLIIPVDSSNPDKAAGTSFFGEVTPSVSSLFGFDIPASDEGKTCTLVFLFPEQSQLETSSFTFSGDGKVDFSMLNSPISTSTNWNNKPGMKSDYSTTVVSPGHSYSVATFPCPAGQAISFELHASGDTKLRYFQDYNPSPIGLYITKC